MRLCISSLQEELNAGLSNLINLRNCSYVFFVCYSFLYISHFTDIIALHRFCTSSVFEIILMSRILFDRTEFPQHETRSTPS